MKKENVIEEIVDTIIGETFIRGIELENYRKNFYDAANVIYDKIFQASQKEILEIVSKEIYRLYNTERDIPPTEKDFVTMGAIASLENIRFQISIVNEK